MSAALSLWSAVAAADSSTIYIIRHGEKTWSGGCLNIQGQERMNNLPQVFDGKGNFSVPNAIFANKYHSQPECERCWLTVQTLAQHLKLPVIFDYGYPKELGGNQGAADAIKKSALANKVVLASWEHYNIQFLTADLGVPKHSIPDWSHNDYDSVYVLTLDGSGAVTGFSVKAQNYVPKSTTCDPAKYVPPPGEPGEAYEDRLAWEASAVEAVIPP